MAPGRYQKMGDFPQLVSGGETTSGAPLYFMAGKHERYPMLDRVAPGQWADGGNV